MTRHEQFWTQQSYAFVGDSAKKTFPRLSYGEAKKLGKTVFAIDAPTPDVEGDRTFADFATLPQKVDAAVLEVPRADARKWVELAAAAGIRSLWFHMNRDTPEALALAKERNIEVLTGACAVMYVKKGPSYHSIHKWIAKATGKY